MTEYVPLERRRGFGVAPSRAGCMVCPPKEGPQWKDPRRTLFLESLRDEALGSCMYQDSLVCEGTEYSEGEEEQEALP